MPDPLASELVLAQGPEAARRDEFMSVRSYEPITAIDRWTDKRPSVRPIFITMPRNPDRILLFQYERVRR